MQTPDSESEQLFRFLLCAIGSYGSTVTHQLPSLTPSIARNLSDHDINTLDGTPQRLDAYTRHLFHKSTLLFQRTSRMHFKTKDWHGVSPSEARDSGDVGMVPTCHRLIKMRSFTEFETYGFLM